MTDYKPNSHKSKVEQTTAVAEKKVEKIVTGNAKVRKKSGARKFTDVFISEDAANVKSYVVMDVIIPAIKDVLSNVVKDSIDMILFGTTRPSGRRSSSSNSSYISYNRYSDKKDERRYESRYTPASRYSFEDIVLEHKGDAEDVLDRMRELLDVYEAVSVADLYDLVGMSRDHTDNNYGWTNLRNARTIRVRDGYMLELPKVTSIK